MRKIRLPHRHMGFDRWDNGCKFRNRRFDILLFQLSKNKSNRRLARAYRRFRLRKESSMCDWERSHELLMVLEIYISGEDKFCTKQFNGHQTTPLNEQWMANSLLASFSCWNLKSSFNFFDGSSLLSVFVSLITFFVSNPLTSKGLQRMTIFLCSLSTLKQQNFLLFKLIELWN